MIAGSFAANIAFATLVPGLWVVQRVRPELFGLRLAGTRRSLRWGVAQFIAWTPWIYAVNFAVRALLATPPETQHPLVDVIRGKEGVSLAILGFLVGCVAAPLGEEVTFRAALQGWLLRRLPGWPSIALSACVFAGLHSSNWPDPIPLFGFGLLLGWIYHQTRSLPTVVVLHALFNLIATAAAYFSE
jgi:membrane protease YdiL (CAAX protease family)